MCILQISATAEVNLLIWIPILGFIMTIIMNILTIIKMRVENKEKLATKDFVNDKVKGISDQVVKVEGVIKDHKDDNIREHGDIKREFHNTVKSMNEKLDIIIKLSKSG